jgi:iron complex outermembrane recepter protein
MPVANPGLVVTAGAAYLDALYTDYRSGSGFDETTGIFSSNLDFTGNTIVRSPKVTANLGLVQTLLLGERSELEIGVDWYYNDGYFFTAQNSVEQGAHDLLGARLSILYMPWDLRVTVFGQNLLDERYNIGKFELDFGVNTTLGDPRTYGLRLDWTF